jgi:cell division protein FtsQ
MTRKPAVRNQRVTKPRQRKQQHLLEVTARRDKATQQRNRAILGFTCKLLLLSSLIAGAYIGSREALRVYLWENPDYFLSDIRVTTNGALTREQILTTAGIVEGKNIFEIDLDQARAALDQLPQVERVELQRVLPSRINVGITERRPIAWVTKRSDEDPTTSEKAFLIDARGVVMRTKTILPEFLHLPIISGVEVENLAPGQKVRTFEMQSALELVRLNADSTRFQVRNIDVAKGYCLVVTDQKRAQITFGLDRVDQQLERLNRLLDHLEPEHREIQTVNLLVERNVPVTFAPEEPVELEPPSQLEPVAAATAPAAKVPAPETKKALPVETRKAVPATSTKKSRSEPVPSKRKSPADSVKKPFRLNG